MSPAGNPSRRTIADGNANSRAGDGRLRLTGSALKGERISVPGG